MIYMPVPPTSLRIEACQGVDRTDSMITPGFILEWSVTVSTTSTMGAFSHSTLPRQAQNRQNRDVIKSRRKLQCVCNI